ncbi:MAG TPA: PIN domain-containing protein [Planctomycetota bacterium]|nr:PIN domain-containing protein [Planctomycetota bacterium]
MGNVIDAGVCISLERRRLGLQGLVTALGGEDCFITPITASELLHGLHRARDPAIRSERKAFVEAAIQLFPLLPIDLDTARVHARLSAELASRGTAVGAHDLWIAASCKARGHGIVTTNPRHFARVPGLPIKIWSEEGIRVYLPVHPGATDG